MEIRQDAAVGGGDGPSGRFLVPLRQLRLTLVPPEGQQSDKAQTSIDTAAVVSGGRMGAVGVSSDGKTKLQCRTSSPVAAAAGCEDRDGRVVWAG